MHMCWVCIYALCVCVGGGGGCLCVSMGGCMWVCLLCVCVHACVCGEGEAISELKDASQWFTIPHVLHTYPPLAFALSLCVSL